MSIISEYVEKELPKLNVASVVPRPMYVRGIIAVNEHFAFLVFAQNDSLFLRHRDTTETRYGGRGPGSGSHVVSLFSAMSCEMLALQHCTETVEMWRHVIRLVHAGQLT